MHINMYNTYTRIYVHVYCIHILIRGHLLKWEKLVRTYGPTNRIRKKVIHGLREMRGYFKKTTDKVKRS